MKAVDSVRPTRVVKNGILYTVTYGISEETLKRIKRIKNRKQLVGWRLYAFEVVTILIIFVLIELVQEIF